MPADLVPLDVHAFTRFTSLLIPPNRTQWQMQHLANSSKPSFVDDNESYGPGWPLLKSVMNVRRSCRHDNQGKTGGKGALICKGWVSARLSGLALGYQLVALE